MVRQTKTHLFSWLGFVAWGDLGPTTIYRNKKGKMVAFSKTWPEKPPSPDQVVNRQKFIDAAIAWQALTPAKRAQWHLAARRASLCMHGYDLYVSWHTTGNDSDIDTLERQTNTDLIP